MLDTTRFTWIVHEKTSVEVLRGAVVALDQLEALPGADVRILPVSAERGITVPPGLKLPDGTVLPAGVLTVDNLPERGILLQGDLG
jgi:hypothetical protein